jgi:hypothetical protein
MIDIKGLDKERILRHLYDAAKPPSRVAPDSHTIENLPSQVALQYLKVARRHTYFAYILGRGLHTDIGGDTLDERAYDAANGSGVAASAIALLRERTTIEGYADRLEILVVEEACAGSEEDIARSHGARIALWDEIEANGFLKGVSAERERRSMECQARLDELEGTPVKIEGLKDLE